MSELTGKTILITGSSRGIGAATARLCAQKGARVIAHASYESEQSSEISQSILNSKEDFLYEDLSKAGAGRRLFGRALSHAGTLDAIINNAGVYQASPLGNTDEWDSAWDKTMAVNVRAPADICHAAVQYCRREARSIDQNMTIINIASRAAQRGDGPDHGAYAASKGAIVAMTKGWARALSGENIHFYLIAPGWVETRMAPEDIANRKKAISEIPLGRVAMPEEVANLACFLLSGACASSVGATFDVNGASYIR